MTTQIPDILNWNGLEFAIGAEPLAPYIRMTDVDLSPPGVLNSACWRGYVARWEVNRDRLYLVDIEGISASAPLSLRDMFPGFGQRVFAHWFTGKIITLVDHQVTQPPSPRPLPLTFRFRHGQVIGPPSEGCSGYLARQFAHGYEDYAPGLSDLSVEISIPEIEAAAAVGDPSGAVTAAPFGHMNWKWEEFKAKLAPGATVWRFSCPWGGSHFHGGYASVVHNRISSFILTSICEIDA